MTEAKYVLEKAMRNHNATSLLYEDNGMQGTLKNAKYFILEAMEEYANEVKNFNPPAELKQAHVIKSVCERCGNVKEPDIFLCNDCLREDAV